jgi:hypothetical protein
VTGRSGGARISRSSVDRLTGEASRAPTRPPSARAIASSAPGQPGGARGSPAGQGRDLPGEGDGGACVVAAEEPADLQMD